jgi:hypothetical protein
MEINNLIEFKKSTDERIGALVNENKFLADVNTRQNEIIKELNLRIEELNQRIDELILYARDIEA